MKSLRSLASVGAPLAAIASALLLRVSLAGQAVRNTTPIEPGDVPAHKTTVPVKTAKAWTPPRTPWGDPDLQGVFSNHDEVGVPLERPSQFDGRRIEDVTEAELAELVRARQREYIERAPTLGELGGGFPGATEPIHWFEGYYAQNSRAWLIADPPDGKIPPETPEARQRAADRALAARAHGPADSWEDRGLYNRCITRGLPGSMMPTGYGSAYQIVQGPGYVAILIEMVHESRMIPLAGRPHVGRAIRSYMGDSRGHWEGTTLVVETTNFNKTTSFRGSTQNLRLIERFKPIVPDTVEWTVTVDDPATWMRPWTFAMNLTRKDDSQRPFEYACHEGNYGLHNILSGARADDKAAEDAAKPQR
jgi:hypothetical protein